MRVVASVPPRRDGGLSRQDAGDTASLNPQGGMDFRSIFISDAHMGTRGCKAAFLADFLKAASCEHLYLVGDIVDAWRLKKSWYWDRDHDRILRRVIKKARNGTAVTYIPGNHDEMLRDWLPLGLEIMGIRFAEEAVHATADGRRLLVIHGDRFDSVVLYAKFLAHLGDGAYTVALEANRVLNMARRRLGYPYWSLSSWLKRQVKGAVKFIDSFEAALARETRERGLDGVVCGHIHHPQMHEVDGILYLNDGDWVESCTALVERHDGTLQLIEWTSSEDIGWAAVSRRDKDRTLQEEQEGPDLPQGHSAPHRR